jgi:hypothetical protein
MAYGGGVGAGIGIWQPSKREKRSGTHDVDKREQMPGQIFFYRSGGLVGVT